MKHKSIGGWKESVRALKQEVHAISLALKDPRTPWPAKVTAFLVIAYACSPIDLIPDCIPILGYLDDLILVPLGIAIVLRMIPGDVLAECREEAERNASAGKPVVSWVGAAFVLAVWLAIAVFAIYSIFHLLSKPR